MIIELDDYIGRAVDPLAPFAAIESDDLLRAAEINPGLRPPSELLGAIAQTWTNNALRLQQSLVYRVGAKLGVLSAMVPKVLGALQSIPNVSAIDSASMIVQALATSIGVASDVMGAVPIVGAIVKGGFAGAELALRVDAAMNTPGTMIGKPLLDAQEYSTEADVGLVNGWLRSQSDTRSWTDLFMPSMKGKLAARVLKSPRDARLVIAWGLRDDGVVPRIVIDDRPVLKPYTWHFSDEGGGDFSETGGMGGVPGAPRIVQLTQSTVLQFQNIHRGHETLGDPRCGSTGKTADINVGLFLPNAANALWSLYGYTTKPSPATYAIDAQSVLHAWEAYADAIWAGVDRLWRNSSWEGGWGCGLLQNALQGLVAQHCVGHDNAIGGFGAWSPPVGGDYDRKLNASDRDAWEQNNFVTKIVKPAMQSLREMQLELLRTTPMAAYLPRQGMGAFEDPSVADEFQRARTVLLSSSARSQRLLLTDVVDAHYKMTLKARGRGTYEGDGGIDDADYQPPRLPLPEGLGASDDDDGGGGALLVAGGLVLLGAAGYGLARYFGRR